MPKITYVEFDGTRHEVDLEPELSLMEGSVLNEIPGIIGLCGGICSCATCHCYIGPEWADKLPPPSEGENLFSLKFPCSSKPKARQSC